MGFRDQMAGAEGQGGTNGSSQLSLPCAPPARPEENYRGVRYCILVCHGRVEVLEETPHHSNSNVLFLLKLVFQLTSAI